MVILIVVVAIVVLILLYLMSTYNTLVKLRNKVKDQWAQIDLIPNLVETVKGYASHEKETLEAVVVARNKAVSASSPSEEIEAEKEVSQTLGRLFALAENYPDLKANTNFTDLQHKLSEVEEKIRFARQFYNDTVLTYKNRLEVFPSNIVANLFGFKPEAFFAATEEERENVKVQF